jgi:hypothetical protein
MQPSSLRLHRERYLAFETFALLKNSPDFGAEFVVLHRIRFLHEAAAGLL